MIKNNKPTGAVTSPEQHDRLYVQRFMESVAQGIAQGDAGLAVSTEEAKRQVKTARKARETKNKEK